MSSIDRSYRSRRAGRTDAFPRAGGQLEAVERADDRPQSIEPGQPRRWLDVLPGEQKPHEIGRADRLDLGAQPVERVAMNAREQPAIAPFELRRADAVKTPRSTTPSPSSVSSATATSDSLIAQDAAERRSRRRPHERQPAAQDLDDRVLARPDARGARRRSHGVALNRGVGMHGHDLRQPLRRDPHRTSAQVESQVLRVCMIASRARSTCFDAADRRARRRRQRDRPGVRKPAVSSASCSSSASRGSGRASSRTRSIAAASSRPRSSAVDGSPARRACTACVRRSSSGASSRNAYGRALMISCASGDGSAVSRETRRRSPR